MTFLLQFIMLVFAGFLTVSSAAAAQDMPRIMVSIKPLHSLVAQIMEGISTPELLVDGTSSPHEFQMKPSHMKALEHADMLIYLDEHYETFLKHTLQALPAHVKTLAVIDAAKIKLLPIRVAGAFESHDDHHAHKDSHAHHDSDYHVWLDPVHAQTMVKAITTTLGTRYPEHKQAFDENAAHTIAHLQKLDETLAKKLTPYHDMPFIIFHDATQYFEARYGLQASGSITLEPNEAISWHRIEAIREKLNDTKARCIFTEPYFSDKQLHPILNKAKSPIHRGMLDPEGTALAAGVSLYHTLMMKMATAFAACLSAT